jgi:hypothetical protein
MGSTFKTSDDGAHVALTVALTVALLAACAANLLLVCSWL